MRKLSWGPTMSHPISMSSHVVRGAHNKRYCYRLRNSKNFRSSVPGTSGKGQMYIFYYTLGQIEPPPWACFSHFQGGSDDTFPLGGCVDTWDCLIKLLAQHRNHSKLSLVSQYLHMCGCGVSGHIFLSLSLSFLSISGPFISPAPCT